MTSVAHRYLTLLGILLISLISQDTSKSLSANEDNRSILLILDASGSMNDRMNGSTRMEVARKEMESFVRDLPPGTELGLIAYGNRIPGCNSSRLYSSLRRNNKSEVLAKLPLFFPAGSTPIAKTLDLVNQHLINSNKKTEIILVSDGIESCDGDPIQEIRTIRRKNPGVLLHVMGLDVPKNEERELEALAQVGGGKYFSIKDRNTMNQAFAGIWNPAQIPNSKKTYPFITITSIEQFPNEMNSINSEFRIFYEFQAQPHSIDSDYTVQVLFHPSTQKTSETPPTRVPKSEWISLSRSVNHTNSVGRGAIRISLPKVSDTMVSTELWDMEGIPRPIAISSSISLGTAKKTETFSEIYR